MSIETEDIETGKKNNLLGVHPGGFLTYGSDCRMQAILVKESREAPAALVATDPESIELYRGLMAYAGSYEVDGDKLVEHIEASWNQIWTGTSRMYRFRIDGTSLFLKTGPGKSPLSGRRSETELIWTRAE